jgi:hypothetical protein
MHEISFNTPTKSTFAGSETVKAIYFRLFGGIGKILKDLSFLVGQQFRNYVFLKDIRSGFTAKINYCSFGVDSVYWECQSKKAQHKENLIPRSLSLTEVLLRFLTLSKMLGSPKAIIQIKVKRSHCGLNFLRIKAEISYCKQSVALF